MIENGCRGEMNILLVPIIRHIELLIRHYRTRENDPQNICYIYIRTLHVLNSIKYSDPNSRQLLLFLFMVERSLLTTEWRTCEAYEMCYLYMFQPFTCRIIRDSTEMEGVMPDEMRCCNKFEMWISVVLTVTKSC
jgi:hypothetical protein